MILSNDKIKEFANITDPELEIIADIKLILKVNPSGKLAIQGQAIALDDWNDRVTEIVEGLHAQRTDDNITLKKVLAAYAIPKMQLGFTDRQIEYKFLNEVTMESNTYEEKLKKLEKLDRFIERLEKMSWDLKSRRDTLRIAHNTDY